MSQTTLASLQSANQNASNLPIGFNTLAGFEAMQRMAKLFSASTIVPAEFRATGERDYAHLGNCVIALDMAMRMGANPLMVMQNLYVVHGGRPAWSAQFLIATLNKCGRFSAIRYEFEGQEGKDDWGCRAVATELATGEKLTGPLITIALAKKEGWFGKNGSKWQTMPELMLRYRAASWFVRAYAPEIAMGLPTAEEAADEVITVDATSPDDTTLDEWKQPAPASQEKTGTDAEETPKNPAPAQAEPRPHKKGSKNEKPADAPEAAKTPEPETPKTDGQPWPPTDDAEEEAFYADAVQRGKEARGGDIECPDPHADGSPRYVTESICMKCRKLKGCPNWEDEQL